jgi:hypothetical protein
MRWSEALGLLPGCLQDNQLRIDWKLYELEGRFYRGRPKDGSIRTVDMPPFLAGLLGWYLATYPPRICTCDSTQPPWCPGERYVFLGPRCGHFRRSNYSSRIVRPAADGWHPKRGGPHARLDMPVLDDMAEPLPGRLLAPWPAAVAGDEFEPPRGKGVRRSPSTTSTASARPAGGPACFAWMERSCGIRSAARCALEPGSSPRAQRRPRGFPYAGACLLMACDTAIRRGSMT